MFERSYGFQQPGSKPKNKNHIKVVDMLPSMVHRSMRIIGILGILFCLTLRAQQVEVMRYDVDGGLPQSMVNHVLQDRDGFIWFGTGDGVARFDGLRYVVYKHDPLDSTSLSSNSIWGLAQADEVHLWIGTRTGLDLLDVRTGRCTHVRTSLPRALDGCWRPVRASKEDALFYSPLNMHFLSVREGSLRLVPSAHDPSYVIKRTSSGEWLSFVQKDSLFYYDDQGGVLTSTFIEVGTDDQVTDVLPLKDELLLLSVKGAWILSRQGIRSELPTATAAWMGSSTARKFAARDANGDIWLAVNERGVARLRFDLTIAQVYPLLDAHQGPLMFTTISFDRQGNVWVGTDGKGVFKIAPQAVKFGRIMPGQGREPELRSYFVRRFAQWDSTRVLINFYQGDFTLFDERTGKLEPLQLDGIPNGADVRQLVIDRDGMLWMVADSALLGYAIPQRSPIRRMKCDYGSALLLDEAEHMLMIDTHGAHRWNGAAGRFASLHYSGLDVFLDSLRNVPRTVLYDDHARLWLSPLNSPFTIWTDKGEDPFSTADKDLLPDEVKFTWVTRAQSGGYWATSNTGLFRWDDHLHPVKNISVREGLPDQYLYGILPGTNEHDLWISSNNGLTRFNGVTGSIRNFGRSDGLQSKEFNLRALFRSHSGRLYFGGVNGVNHFEPAQVPSDTDRAIVRIVRLSSDGAGINPYTRTLALPYSKNRLEMEFAVLEFTSPERNRFRYRMPGYLDEWRTSTPATPLVLEHLPDGDYTLEVQGVNGDDVVSPTLRILTIHVPLPFWASRWAFVLAGSLVASAVGALVFLAYRRRSRERERKAEVEMKELRIRTRLAKDIHDDVGSGLARISALSRSVQAAGDEERLRKVASISSELLSNLRDVVWMNDPRHDDLENMLLRIKDHAFDLLEPLGIVMDIVFPEPLPIRTIDGNTRHHLFLIAKEALHNIAKYAGARKVVIRFILDGNRYVMELRDDGRGLPLERSTVGNGMKNMRQRALALNAVLDIGPSPDGGVRVLLSGTLDEP